LVGAASSASALDKPVVISPKEISEFRGVSEIEFKWTDIAGASQYHVTLAKDRKFKHVVHDNPNVTGTSYRISDLDFGTYFFRVSPSAEDSSEGPFSNTLSFIIVPPPPATALAPAKR